MSGTYSLDSMIGGGLPFEKFAIGPFLPAWFNEAVDLVRPEKGKPIALLMGEEWRVPHTALVRREISTTEWARIYYSLPYKDWMRVSAFQSHKPGCNSLETHRQLCEPRDFVGRSQEALQLYRPDETDVLAQFPYVKRLVHILPDAYWAEISFKSLARVDDHKPSDRDQFFTPSYREGCSFEGRELSKEDFFLLLYFKAFLEALMWDRYDLPTVEGVRKYWKKFQKAYAEATMPNFLPEQLAVEFTEFGANTFVRGCEEFGIERMIANVREQYSMLSS